MNFYAHLVAASWQSPDPIFALGAMLPDLANMAGVRLELEQSDAIASGIEFHHRCDQHFHKLDLFRAHERWTLAHLLRSGLRRGPARGVAHVGVELCLDGALSGQADALYLGALASGRSGALRWKSEEKAKRFDYIVSRLQDFGVPVGYQDPSIVTQRLVRLLAPRRLLALQQEEPTVLGQQMPLIHRRVSEDAAQVMAAMRAAI